MPTNSFDNFYNCFMEISVNFYTLGWPTALGWRAKRLAWPDSLGNVECPVLANSSDFSEKYSPL